MFLFFYRKEDSAIPTSSNASTITNDASMPNIAANIEFKLSQMVGNTKAIYLILLTISTSSSLSMLVNENDDYNFYKFKLEIRNFLIEMLDYLRIQQADMNSFLIVQSKNGQKDEEITDTKETSDEEKHSKKLKLDDEAEKTKVTTGASASSPTSLRSNNSSDSNSDHAVTLGSKNPIHMQIMRQVEYKKKHLDHIIQVLVQTINFLSTSLSDSPFASTSTNSDSSSQSSSTESDSSDNASKQTSLSSSPSHESSAQKTT